MQDGDERLFAFQLARTTSTGTTSRSSGNDTPRLATLYWDTTTSRSVHLALPCFVFQERTRVVSLGSCSDWLLATTLFSLQDPSVVAKHHEWGKQAGIDFFAMAWSGGGSDLIQWERADEIDRRIASHLKVHDGVKVALMYNIRDFVQAGSHGKIDLAGSLPPTYPGVHVSFPPRQHERAPVCR